MSRVLPNARRFDRQTFQHIQHKQLDESGRGPLFSLVSPEDVILNKLEWYKMSGGSERQWSDVQGVLKVQGPALDFTYMRAGRLKLTWLTCWRERFSRPGNERG